MPKLLFWLLLLSLVLLRFLTTRPVFKEGDTIRISTRIITEPLIFENEEKDPVQYLKLKGLKVYLPVNPEVTYGDYILLEGKVDKGKLTQIKLVKLDTDKPSIYHIRERLVRFYKVNISEPHASLVSGTVLGSKSMPQDFWDKLKKTGTAHVVVASGTNVSLLAGFLISIFTVFLKRNRAILLSLTGIIVYVFISGFDAPIVRAGIMGSITFLGQIKGKLIKPYRLLFLTALIMLLIKPVWISDLGFILSFVATLSLMLFQKRIDLKLNKVPTIIREGLSTSLAAQIGVAPIIFLTFGQFNFLSPLINALILWTVPYIMVIGSIAGVIDLIIPAIGRLILYLVYPFTIWFTKVIYLF